MRRTFALMIVPVLALAACGKDTDTTTIKGADGQTVTIETDRDGDGPARMEATNENGEKVTATMGGAGTAWPADAPAYAAAYPGATVTSVIDTTSGDKGGSMATFQTSDAPEKVIAHYKALAARAGLDQVSTVEANDTRMFTATNKAGNQVYVQTSIADGMTNAALTFSKG